MTYGELGRFKFTNMIDLRMIEFGGRTVASNDHKLPYNMYIVWRTLHGKGLYSSPWISKTHHLCNRIGVLLYETYKFKVA